MDRRNDVSTAPTCLVNGEPCEQVPVTDRGFQYGDGLFETIAVGAGHPLLWERHLARLGRGAARLRIPAPVRAQLEPEALALCRGADRAVLKILVTRGPGGRGYAPPPDPRPMRVLQRLPWPEHPAEYRTHGVTVRLCQARLGHNPLLAGIKHLNRLEQILARAELDGDHAEGLMLDGEDAVIEGTMTNVFAVCDGAVMTPDLSRCGVAGIIRELVLERLPQARVTQISLQQLLGADEIFLTNSIIGVWPVAQLGSRSLAVGPVTRTVQRLLQDAEAVI